LSEEMLDFGFQYLEKSADIFLNMASIFDSIGNQKIAFIRHRICSMWVSRCLPLFFMKFFNCFPRYPISAQIFMKVPVGFHLLNSDQIFPSIN